jgi:hypothetical protein
MACAARRLSQKDAGGGRALARGAGVEAGVTRQRAARDAAVVPEWARGIG